jgi:hypothetical protein
VPDPDPPDPHEYRVTVDGLTVAYQGPDRGEALRAYFYHELWGAGVELTDNGKPVEPD